MTATKEQFDVIYALKTAFGDKKKYKIVVLFERNHVITPVIHARTNPVLTVITIQPVHFLKPQTVLTAELFSYNR